MKLKRRSQAGVIEIWKISGKFRKVLIEVRVHSLFKSLASLWLRLPTWILQRHPHLQPYVSDSTSTATGPIFVAPVGNQTAAIGREVVFSCSVRNIGKYKVTRKLRGVNTYRPIKFTRIPVLTALYPATGSPGCSASRIHRMQVSSLRPRSTPSRFLPRKTRPSPRWCCKYPLHPRPARDRPELYCIGGRDDDKTRHNRRRTSGNRGYHKRHVVLRWIRAMWWYWVATSEKFAVKTPALSPLPRPLCS